MSVIDRAFIRAYQAEGAPAERKLARAPIVAAGAVASASPALRVVAAAPTALAPPAMRQPASASLAAEDAPPQRRPLSTFAATRPVEAHFKPALEVDAFRWSRICQDLVSRHADRLRPVVQTLLAADDAGRSLIGVGSAVRGAGSTTLVACLARLLVDAGKSVAIVDGNFAAPGLSESLGVAADAGWEEVLAGRLSLAECVIQSLGDGVALLPLVHGGATAAEQLDSIHASVTGGVLRYHYDMVLVDVGALGDAVQGPIARRLAQKCRLDGLIILSADVSDIASVQPQRLMQTAPELASICLGVIENQLRAA